MEREYLPVDPPARDEEECPECGAPVTLYGSRCGCCHSELDFDEGDE